MILRLEKKKLEKRVGHLFSEFLLTEVRDIRLHEYFVSVSRVEFNEDLSRVTIFFQSLNDEKRNKVVKMLYKLTPFFINYLKQRLSLRRIPKMVYIYDVDYQKSSDVLKMIETLSQISKKDETF